jgi:hypothetical protein
MKIHHFSTIGSFHTNHNEDSYVVAELGGHHQLLAVMDGCSMGTESHFASTLVRKLLREISKKMSFKAFAEQREESAAVYLGIVLRQLFQRLARLKNELLLDQYELLTTLLLTIVDTQQRTAEVIAIGDGLIGYNEELIEYEQNNQPDYLGYHVSGDFDNWLSRQTQRLSLQNIHHLSLSSDGIFTFTAFDTNDYPTIGDAALLDYLLIDQQWSEIDTNAAQESRNNQKTVWTTAR